ncbi:transposase, Mutator family protein [Mycobacterium xenopi 4042]|uniref:Mutator family transposase n=1 Tax=Mycobacterium xenopi 4042 TaxID=1299334 RepID=X8APZ9_MYCXE|nr:transposase, Mutator family protein [Mycobacterium xenopi 4042]
MSSVIDEIVREGAQQMLAAALRAEVAAYCAQFADERDENGHRLVVRNGYHEPREVTTAAGAIEVHAPRVNDKRVDPETGERVRFSSAILPPWARKTRRWSRCCRCCTCMGSRRRTSGRRWASFWARPRACRRPRSPS